MEQNGENVISNFTSQDKPTTELLFSAFDLLNDGICILSDDHTILKVNKSFCTIFNTTPNNILQKTLTKAFANHKNCKSEIKKIINLNGSDSTTFHSAAVCSGKRILIQNTVSKFRDNNNNLFYLWIVKDQSDYMKMKETLKAEIEDLRITIKSIGDGVITIGSAGQVLYINPEAERLTGWKKSFAEGKNLSEIFHIMDELTGEEFEFPIDKVLVEGKKINFSNNTILISRTGIKTPIAYSGNPIRNDAGNVKGVAIVFRDETENHIKKKLIEESEARFSSVFHSSLSGITLSTLNDGKFVDVNERFLEATGYTRDEVIGSTSIQVGLWTDEKIRDHFIELLTEYKRVKEIDFEFQTKSGETRLGQISAELVKVAGKTFVLSLINDITENKQAEIALRTSEIQLKTALEIAHLGHWEYDVINDVFIFNENFYKLLHTSAEQEGGYLMPSAKYAQRFVHPDDIQMVGTEIQKAIETTDPDFKSEIEHRIIYADGGTGTIAVRYFITKDSHGKTIKTYGVNQDITKQKLAEQAIETEKDELNVTLKNIRDGVISTNSEDKIVLINKSITEITGWEKEELIGKSIVEFFELMNADYTTLAGKSKLSTIFGMNENNESTTSEALEIESKDGSKKIIFCNSAQIKDSDENLKGYVYVLKDITEQVKTETQLQLSQKMESVGQLAAGIAHEINTPMQYIMDNTVFVKDSFNSLNEYIKLVDKFILESNNSESIKSKREELDLDFLLDEIPAAISQTESGIDRVSKIVRAMKDFSHPGQKEKVMADLNHGIEVTATISKNEWKYHADLQLNLDKNIPLVFCNIDEINQVILNMIVNAAHAIQEKINKTGNNEKGIINILTKFENDFVIIEISDTGMGIPAEIKEKIFDPFFTTKVVGKGTGQGLAIAHNIIITKHKGFISVDSKVGKGTTFIIKIPSRESL